MPTTKEKYLVENCFQLHIRHHNQSESKVHTNTSEKIFLQKSYDDVQCTVYTIYTPVDK